MDTFEGVNQYDNTPIMEQWNDPPARLGRGGRADPIY
jgi:hypothetical protein